MDYNVLIADNLAPVAAGVLADAGINVKTRHGLNEDQLVEAIKGFHGILVRSAVKVTSRVIQAGADLKVIGRAGIGVDNIDVRAANDRGVLVFNVPGGNSITAAEHTLGLMFCLARNIPAAAASMKAGRWDRKRFSGRELTGL
ncbi:MAG: 3-phosphoglycerate dehydrogenase, partial [Deltaproteobacteria bacterium]|nr:3-phosphoglycerate dehydrogenase [Deltaproteobacteria bacterium]